MREEAGDGIGSSAEPVISPSGPRETIILGIDPGSRKTGWGLIASNRGRPRYLASGTIRLESEALLARRLVILADALEAILSEHKPDECAVEQIFTARNARSALVLAHARGVAIFAVARHEVALFEYAPNLVKQAVVGAGKADKRQVNQMVKALLGRTQLFQEDEADALALALTHAAASRLEKLA